MLVAITNKTKIFQSRRLISYPGQARLFFTGYVATAVLLWYPKGITQWVERPTEKPGGSSSRFLFPRINFQCRLSYGVRTAPVCNIVCINICAHVKDPKHWQPYHCLEERCRKARLGVCRENHKRDSKYGQAGPTM